MIKAVLFDLDGTLLNRDASVENFIDNQYERLLGVLCDIPKATYISRFIELDCNGYVWKDKVYQQLVQELQITGVTWEGLLNDYLSEFRNSCIPFSHLIQVLETLKRESIQLGLITNGRDPFQLDNINALGIRNYFDIILVSELEGIKKPNPEIFYRASRKLGVSPEESMYVGDHLENDVKASKKVGMVSVWKNAVAKAHKEADFMINDLDEILSILNLE